MDGCTWTGEPWIVTDEASTLTIGKYEMPVRNAMWGLVSSTDGVRLYVSEGENKMEKLLTDLVVNLQLGREELDAIRAIIKHPDWKERYMLYLLADDVRSCDFMPETLGYKELED